MKWRKIIIIIFLLVWSPYLMATHIRGGQITAVRLSPNSLTYRFTLTVYTDNRGVPPDESAIINFAGLQEIVVPLAQSDDSFIIGDTKENRYYFNFTFPGPGTYKIVYIERNRNGCIVNMSSPSQTAFSIETEITIDPFLGINNTPVLLNPPVDKAGLGQKFLHNPSAFDIDGDSLSYRLITPKKSANQVVDDYQTLDNFLTATGENGGAPSFSIDPVTGTITWDSPSSLGCFNVAFMVEEWRNGIRIGYVVRDMQIYVEDSENLRPLLTIPDPLCVTAEDEIVNETITAVDPDGHAIVLSSTSALYENGFIEPLASFTPDFDQPQASPASATFRWEPSCEHVRERPYQVLFKAEDRPPQDSSFVDIKILEITVLGPAPNNLQAAGNAENNGIELTWDPYLCASEGIEIIIWRKEGCNEDELDACDVEMEDQNYIPIGRVASTAAPQFIDNDVRKGLRYTYRLTASFPPPRGGKSQISDAVCVALRIDVPLITKVDIHPPIVSTSTSNGTIDIQWIKPLEIDNVLFPEPYSYEVFRADGINGNNFVKIHEINNADLGTLSFSFTDNNLNTEENAYTYRIALFYDDSGNGGNNRTLKGSSDPASSVFLQSSSGSDHINLTWDFNVPWTNDLNETRIYRYLESNPVPELIGTAELADKNFTDNGSFNNTPLEEGTIYCYYVETVGTFDNPVINVALPDLEPLLNKSQISCNTPLDLYPPCPPLLSVIDLDCENFEQEAPFENILNWEYAFSSDLINEEDSCEYEIPNRYKIYYKAQQNGDFIEIGEVAHPQQTFVHDNLNSLAGCYAVTALDDSGNESDLSNTICVENCFYYELPNVFTPNGDGNNDLFVPFPTPRFVESVAFEVFNRWGKKVFSKEDDIFLNWKGNYNLNGGDEGKELPSGVYYYTAKVKFISLNSGQEVVLKGWVQILR